MQTGEKDLPIQKTSVNRLGIENCGKRLAYALVKLLQGA